MTRIDASGRDAGGMDIYLRQIRDAALLSGAEECALAEAINGLYKTECVYGPDACGWDDVSHLELATLSWVHWFNEERPHGYCGDIPPAEFEAAFYAGNDRVLPGLGNQ